MSWRNVPDPEKPPEALSGPGHGKGKGVGKQTHAAKAVEDAYGPGPIMGEINSRDPLFDPAEYIPHFGSVIFQDGLTGKTRYDTHNQLFRCIVRCPRCRADMCNRRMWFALDNHPQHYCRRCQQDLGLGGQPDLSPYLSPLIILSPANSPLFWIGYIYTLSRKVGRGR